MLHFSLMILSPLHISSDESFCVVTLSRPRAQLLDDFRRRAIVKRTIVKPLLDAANLHRAAELVRVVAVRRAVERTVVRWTSRLYMNEITRRRLTSGLMMIEGAPRAVNPYILAPCYDQPIAIDQRCVWTPPPAAPAIRPPHPMAVRDAVELAETQQGAASHRP